MVLLVTALVAALGAPLVPEISVEYGISIDLAQWTLTLTLLVGAVATPVIGRLGGGMDRVRPFLLCGLGIVALGLILCILPLGVAGLLTGRALQGIGLALAPLAMTAARAELPPGKSVRTIAQLSVTAVAGAGLAFPLSAFIAGHLGLNAVYALGLTALTLTVVAVRVSVPVNARLERRPADISGILLLTASGGMLLLAISQSASWGWVAAGLALAGTILVGIWVRHSMRTRYPLVDLRLAAGPGVLVAHLCALLSGAGTYLMLPLVMLVAQDSDGADLPLTVTGLLWIPYAVLSVLGNRLAQRLRRRLRVETVLIGGAAFFAAGNGLLAFLHTEPWHLAVAMTLGGVGSGLSFAVIAQLVTERVPLNETASALGFNLFIRYLGFSVGSALIPALLAVQQVGTTGPSDPFRLPFSAAVLLFGVSAVAVGVTALGRRKRASSDTRRSPEQHDDSTRKVTSR